MDPVTFRRWRNKSYAVFASLKKVIRIGTLSIAYTLLAMPDAKAQGDTTIHAKFIELEEVELVEEAAPLLLTSGVSPLLVISSDEIASSGVQSVSGILESVPHADLRERGAFGVQADISLRGGSFDQTMVLLNGIEINDPQTGHFNLNLPLDPEAIDHIEILKGPAAAFYGVNCYTGAVNIVTRPDTVTGISFSSSLGSFNRWRSSALINVLEGKTSVLLHYSAGSSEGYRQNTDYRNGNLFLHASRQDRFIKTSFHAGLNGRKFGANAFYSLKYPDQYEETSTGFAAFELASVHSSIPLKLNGGLRLNNDYFVLKRTDPAFYRNYHHSASLNLNLTSAFETTAGLSRFGLGFKNDNILSTVLGLPLEEPVIIMNTQSEYYTAGDHRSIFNLTFNQRKKSGPLTISAGGFLYLNGFFNDQPVLFPGAEIAYELNSSWSVYSSIYRTLRLPTFTDLYYHGPQNEGNPELKPERALSMETGLTGTMPALKTGFSVFCRNGKETIDWVWMDDGKWHTMNYSSLLSYGGEVFISIFPGKTALPLRKVDKLELSFSYTGISKQPGEYLSYYALDYLKYQGNLSLVLEPFSNFFIMINSRYQQRNGSYLSYDITTGQSAEADYQPFFLSDLRLSYRVEILQFYLDCGNIFNTAYMDFGGLPQPGRWFSLGLRIN